MLNHSLALEHKIASQMGNARMSLLPELKTPEVLRLLKAVPSSAVLNLSLVPRTYGCL